MIYAKHFFEWQSPCECIIGVILGAAHPFVKMSYNTNLHYQSFLEIIYKTYFINCDSIISTTIVFKLVVF